MSEEKQKEEDKIVDLLMCIFLGGLGIHRFLKGYNVSGILWLCTGGLFGVGVIIDAIYIATDKPWIMPQ
ncbi:MAG: NINE protein [Candidatus Heimdallarchaeota archaeon]|nr:NINE protein [Candidatus Heimdallarchaeota archaeon]